MAAVQTGAAWVLAAVLAAAAVAKLRRPAATAEGFAQLGLVGSGLLAHVVPVAELACAVALVFARPWGGVASFALLAGFTAVLANVVRSGLVVACNCFGSTGAAPVTPTTLARNAGLLTLAAVAAL